MFVLDLQLSERKPVPQRLLRPAIRQSKRWNRLPYITQTLWLRLLTLVDDFARYDADPELLRSECFPYGDPDGNPIPVTTIDSMMLALVSSDMVILYEYGGKRYLQLTRWQERTRSESKWPDPKTCKILTIDGKCQQMIASSPSPQPSPTPSGNGHVCVSEFETFWKAYPKKVKRIEAERVFVSLRAFEKMPAILKAIEIQGRLPLWLKDGGRFIPNPDNWLGDGRWMDEVAEPDDPKAVYSNYSKKWPWSGPGPQRSEFVKGPSGDEIYQAVREGFEKGPA